VPASSALLHRMIGLEVKELVPQYSQEFCVLHADAAFFDGLKSLIFSARRKSRVY
jgi:hypothetical protein